MGSSSKSKQNNQQLDRFANRDEAINQSELEWNRGSRDGENARLGQTYDAAFGGYGQQQTGGMTPEQEARLRAAGQGQGGGGGGYEGELGGQYGNIANGGMLDMSRLQASDPVWQEMMKTGGFSPEEMASLGDVNQNLKDLGKTGGFDPEALNRARGNGGYEYMQSTGGLTDENRRNMRAGGVYEDFSKTGGLTEQDKSLYRDRINAAIPATYDAFSRDVANMGRVTGSGAGPAAQAMASRMSRDAARENAQTSRDAELAVLDRMLSGKRWGAEGMTSSEQGIADRDIAARQWGTKGMSDSEMAMQGLRTGNILQGSNSAYGNEMGTYNARNANKITGAEGWQENERYNTNLKISESERGLAGMEGLNSAAAGRGAASAAGNLNNEWDILNFQNDNKRYGTAGMESMYNTSQNAMPQYSDRILNTRSTDAANVGANVQQRADLNPSRMSQIQSGVGTAAQLAGAVGGVMTGVGALGGVAGQARNRAMGTRPGDQGYGVLR